MEGKDWRSFYLSKPWLKFYPEGVPAEVEIPQKSIIEAFDESIEKWGKGRVSTIFYGRKITYGELKDQSDRFATALWELGVRKGDRIALYLVNCPQFVIALLGALRIGATVVPISPVYVSPEVRYQIEDSGSSTIVCLDLLYDKVERANVHLKNIILTSVSEYLPTFKKMLGKSVLRGVYQKMALPSPKIYEREGIYRFQDLIKKYEPRPPKVDINPQEDIAVLPYTGGTTGNPKGVMITHHYVMASRAQIAAFENHKKEGQETLIAYMPFYHIAGLGETIMASLIYGYTMVIFSTPDLDAIINAVEDYGATYFVGSPALYEALRDFEKTDRVDWKRLKSIDSGADVLLEDTAMGWQRRTGTVIIDHWGMTEFTAAMANPRHRPKLGSIGVPVPNVKAAVVHPDSTEFLPPGEIGELIVTGAHMMKGYWNRPEETREVFVEIDGERWLKTGDLVKMDDEGYFYFYDRKKDMIKYKGYSVFAREIEEVLTSHPKIKDAAVIGVPNPKVGQDIKAVIVLESEARGRVSEEEILKYCEERLAHYKVPKIIEFRGEIPKTDVGKVSRRELREEAEEEL